jgi:glutamyl-tRNA(Gln) amidotransferase subunit D
MHKSRRDTFRPIDAQPIAKIHAKLNTIEILAKEYPKKDAKRIPKLFDSIETRVGLFKVYPGMKADQLDWFEKNCNGLVIEAYAFGQMPINKLDNLTAHHPELIEKLSRLSAKMPVYIASQVPYGRINMNVYSTSRDILKAGAKPAYMLASTAFVKLCWALGQSKDRKKVDEIMQEDAADEICSRTEQDDFPDKKMEK